MSDVLVAPRSLGQAWGVKPATSYNGPVNNGTYGVRTGLPQSRPSYGGYRSDGFNRFANTPGASAPARAQQLSPTQVNPAISNGLSPQVPSRNPTKTPIRGVAGANPLSKIPQGARGSAVAGAALTGLSLYGNLQSGQGPFEAVSGALADPFTSTAGQLSGGLLAGPLNLGAGYAAALGGGDSDAIGQATNSFNDRLGADAVADRLKGLLTAPGRALDNFFGFGDGGGSSGGPADDYTGLQDPGFAGGQMDGRSYFVQANVKTYDDEGELRTDSNYSGSLIGPVTTGQVSLSGVGADEVDFLFVGAWGKGDPPRVEDGSVRGKRVGVLSPAEGITSGTAAITNLIPSGSAPDTGGDPPPTPGPVTPARVPQRNSPTQPQGTQPENEPPSGLPWGALPLAIGAGGLAAGAAGALAPNNLSGPGPSRPTTPAKPPTVPKAPSKPSPTPGGGGAGGPSGTQPPTKPKPKCGCNKGILDGMKNLLTGNVGQGAQLGLLAKIDATTTATRVTAVTNAGQLGAIATKLQTMQAFAEKAWQNTHVDKLINLLTLTTVIHNGAMISRDIGDTMGYVVSNALAVVGVKDESGNALDINGLVGSSVSNFIKSVVGEDVYNDTRTAWQKANRVLQAGSNIIWTIRNINDATQDVLEWTAENTGKIGNALIKYGVVGDRAYPFMSERVKAQDFYRRKFSRVFDGLESAENTASSLAVVTSNVREIQEEVNELGEARTRFTDAVSDFGPEDTPGLPPENQLPSSSPENQPIATAEAEAEAASQSPDVAIATDANRGDLPDDATP